MPFASPRRSSSCPRSSGIHTNTNINTNTQYQTSNPPHQLKRQKNTILRIPNTSTTTIASSIAKKSALRYCCLVNLFGTQKKFRRKKKRAVVVVVGAVHRRRLSPTTVVRERRERGSVQVGKRRSGSRSRSYIRTGSGADIGTAISTGRSKSSSSIKRRHAITTVSPLQVTSVFNPTAPLPPIPQEGEFQFFGSEASSTQIEEVENTTQASCPPAARHPLIIFVRAYKKRRRHAAGTEKQDEEAAVVAAVPHDDENRTGKHRDRRSGASSKSRNSRGFQSADIISPVPRAVHSQQETRDIVEQGFHRSRRSASEGSHDGFEAGYSMWNGGPGQIPQQQQQPDTMTAHIVGKIERIMGNPLSNDFYNDRASGTGHSRNNSKEKKRESKRHSYPLTAAPIRPRPKTLELDTNLSPISPNETELSTTRDFSPYSADITGIFKSLSPPPAAPAAIALRYPNVTALVRANIPAETSKRSSYRSSHRASSRFSYTQLHDETRLGEHISSQYNSAKEKIASPLQAPTSGQELAPLPSPPAWAAFGGFSARTSKSSSSQPSHSSGEKSGFASDAPTPTPSIKSANNSHGHTHRISWNGRSVLDLDGPPPPVPRKRTPPPPPPSASPRPLRRKEHIATPPSSPPKFATAPRIRTSAFGPRSYPAPPPIPPDPQDIAVGSTSMRRSGSIGKMSVLSVPSTISSFNTVGTVSRTMGLSPTPARVTPRNTPEPIVNEKDRRSAISGISGTSEGSSVTVKELQMEMGRIRARARRAEVERRARRREDDDGQQKSWLAEEEPGMDQDLGQRFF